MNETTKLLLQLLENCIIKNNELEKRIEKLEGVDIVESDNPSIVLGGLEEAMGNNPGWFCTDGGLHEYDELSTAFPPRCLKCSKPAEITGQVNITNKKKE